MMSQASVLVIEDDPVFQQLVSQYLSQLDYDVQYTDSGRDGIAICQQQLPDVIICDLQLPDISGLQVIEALLALASDLPVIVVSASESMADIRDAVRLGAWDYLVKPLDGLTALNDAIQHCLNRYQLEETFVHDRWELDDHIDVLYQDDTLVNRLAGDLLPQGPLELGGYQFALPFISEQPNVWIDYRPLLDDNVLVIMASPRQLTEQALLPLLVFKTLVGPLLRQHLAGGDNTLIQPDKLLQHMNNELCHSRIRTAFDVWCGVLDIKQRQWRWAQAGDRIVAHPQAKPDLALGIWQRAQFHCHVVSAPSHLVARVAGSAEIAIRREPPQTDAAPYPNTVDSY